MPRIEQQVSQLDSGLITLTADIDVHPSSGDWRRLFGYRLVNNTESRTVTVTGYVDGVLQFSRQYGPGTHVADDINAPSGMNLQTGNFSFGLG